MLPVCQGGVAPVIKGLPSAQKLGGLWGGWSGGETLDKRIASTYKLGDLGPTFYPSEPQYSYLENGYDNSSAGESVEGWNETRVYLQGAWS